MKARVIRTGFMFISRMPKPGSGAGRAALWPESPPVAIARANPPTAGWERQEHGTTRARDTQLQVAKSKIGNQCPQANQELLT